MGCFGTLCLSYIMNTRFQPLVCTSFGFKGSLWLMLFIFIGVCWKCVWCLALSLYFVLGLYFGILEVCVWFDACGQVGCPCLFWCTWFLLGLSVDLNTLEWNIASFMDGLILRFHGAVSIKYAFDLLYILPGQNQMFILVFIGHHGYILPGPNQMFILH